jgi:hypothetical protein
LRNYYIAEPRAEPPGRERLHEQLDEGHSGHTVSPENEVEKAG